jgi:hypothetical protein
MTAPTIVVIINASIFRRSKIMPVIPNIKDTGNENIISSPPRAARGSPQPGWIKQSARKVIPPMASMIDEIIPNRISWSVSKETICGIYVFKYLV